MLVKCNKTNVCKTIKTLNCIHAKHHELDINEGCSQDTCDTERIDCECKPVRKNKVHS